MSFVADSFDVALTIDGDLARKLMAVAERRSAEPAQLLADIVAAVLDCDMVDVVLGDDDEDDDG